MGLSLWVWANASNYVLTGLTRVELFIALNEQLEGQVAFMKAVDESVASDGLMDFEFIFKFLLLSPFNAGDPVWDALQPQTLPSQVIPGIEFGIKAFQRKKGDYIKVFVCSFNPQKLMPIVRRSYVHGANGVIVSIPVPDDLSFRADHVDTLKGLLGDILETNKSSIPHGTFLLLLPHDRQNHEEVEEFKAELQALVTQIFASYSPPQPWVFHVAAENELRKLMLEEVMPAQLLRICRDIESETCE